MFKCCEVVELAVVSHRIDTQTCDSSWIYDGGNPFTKVTLVGIIFMLVLSVPIVIWAARNSVNSMFFNDTEPTTLRWITMGSAIAIGSACLGASSENVVLFFDVVGGFFTPTIIFFMPALFYIKNQRNEPLWKICTAYAIAGFTIISVCACVYQAGLEIAHAIKN